ncbi:hypothetical protein BHE74_00008099 [Ensete ventricosum]|nr:hypothetical protein BHE74_00008099 [Ensete ventricosum]RZR80880.1 hypothetical protein BHM03_00006986 [Ensete ventricosum]
MGQCYGKNISVVEDGHADRHREQPSHANGGADSGGAAPATPLRRGSATPLRRGWSGATTPVHSSSTSTTATAWPSPYQQGSASPLPAEVSPSPARSTPRRLFRRPFPPPSPAKHIRIALAKRQGLPKPKESPIPEDGNEAVERPLDKSFGYGKNFETKYELGKEVGRGHFGHTCLATAKKGEIKGQFVAVKIISKAKVRWVGNGQTFNRYRLYQLKQWYRPVAGALTDDELFYLRVQFKLLEPNKDGHVSLENFRMNASEAMREARVPDILNAELNLPSTSYSVLRGWIRPEDRKFSFLGYTKYLLGATIRSSNTRHR